MGPHQSHNQTLKVIPFCILHIMTLDFSHFCVQLIAQSWVFTLNHAREKKCVQEDKWNFVCVGQI